MRYRNSLRNGEVLEDVLLKKLAERLGLSSNVSPEEVNRAYFSSVSTGVKKVDRQTRATLDDLLFLKRVRSTRDWNRRWASRIEEIYLNYDLVPEFEVEGSPEDIERRPQAESLTEYVTRAVHHIRGELGLSLLDNYHPSMSTKYSFEDLNYQSTDSPYNLEETFFLEERLALVSHLTPFFSHNPNTNLIGCHKVFRRETPDKTHLCEFTQLEIQKVASREDPVEELKLCFLKILDALGLETDHVEFRMTRYPYVSPGFEIYYTKEGEFLEVGGCGIMLNSLMRDDRIYLAGAIGVERCYALSHGLKSVNKSALSL